MGGSDHNDVTSGGLGDPPSTAPPPSVRAAILARVLKQSVGDGETPLLDGRYRLLREIGRGGAGTVWEAELLPLGRLVAVKLLRRGVASNPKAVARLVREAMTVSRLGHEHIVQVNDVGIDEHGSPYIAMELLEGESLTQLVARRGRLPWSQVAEIATQLCGALSAAHAVGIVHRDVKPANVFATRRDDRWWRCKLLDFGLCTGGRDTAVLTAAGILLGTPGYAAPEQLRGELVDGRADLYGLACVMVELLTGRPAFRGGSRQEVVGNQLAGRRCGELDTLDLSPEVVALIDRGLCVSARDRHDNPEAFARLIASVPRQQPPPTPSSETTSRSKAAWAVRAAIVATLAGVGVVAMVPGSSETKSVGSEPRALAPPPVSHESVEPTPVASTRDVVEESAAPEADVRESPGPALVERPSPARVKRVRPRVPKPRAAPEVPAPPVRQAYADGIRDPFATPQGE